jgi:hypothetical protein
VFVERPAGTLEPYGLQTQGSYPHSISRGCVVERAPALSGPLPALGAFAVAALAGPLDLGRGPLERGADLVGLDLGHRPLVTLGVSQLRWRSRPMTITRSPLDRVPVVLPCVVDGHPHPEGEGGLSVPDGLAFIGLRCSAGTS